MVERPDMSATVKLDFLGRINSYKCLGVNFPLQLSEQGAHLIVSHEFQKK